MRTSTIIVHIAMCLCVLIEVGQLLVCFKKGSKAAKVAFIRNPEVGWQKKVYGSHGSNFKSKSPSLNNGIELRNQKKNVAKLPRGYSDIKDLIN